MCTILHIIYMSFQGALRVMQCQICVTDLGERWRRELCVGRERLRADSNSHYKNSSRQEGRKEPYSPPSPPPPPARPTDDHSQESHTATLHKLKNIHTNKQKKCFNFGGESWGGCMCIFKTCTINDSYIQYAYWGAALGKYYLRQCLRLFQ